MAPMKLYGTPAALLLLLALAWSLRGGCDALPVGGRAPLADSCALRAQTLLRNVTAALTQEDLFRPIDCSKQNLELNAGTSTPSACAPKESTCSGSSKLKFDQDSCLAEIEKDLSHYYRLLAARQRRHNVSTVLASLRGFMENCWSLPTDSPAEAAAAAAAAAAERAPTYDERLDLCKKLKGFQVRTVSINRAIAYMNSGEHMK